MIFLVLFFLAGFAQAIDRYIATTGSDVANNCTSIVTPCLTLQYAVNQSLPGDVIHIAAGTYTDPVQPVSINKTLTILGAQAGVDARNPRGAESVLSNPQGISVSADNVIFNGLTIQDSSVAAFTGYGLWINPNINGSIIINNIFQNNIVGLGLSSGGASQCLVEHNLFQNNNLPGGASGTGIYSDQFVSQQLSNILINENSFKNNNNAGIVFTSTNFSEPDFNITITNNTIDSCGRGIFLLNTQQFTITNNTITNLTSPTDGGASSGIALFGANNNISILENNIINGLRYGIRLIDFVDFDTMIRYVNTNIIIHQNNIFGFAEAAMRVDNAPLGPIDYATCNYWGSITGPTSPLNPGGTGDNVSGALVLANFMPWLLGLAPDASCGITPPTSNRPSIKKAFTPSSITVKEKSTLVITLSNPNDTPAKLVAPLIDRLPLHLKFIGNPINTCGGNIRLVELNRAIKLTGGAIPANGSCSITINVSSLGSCNSCPCGKFTNIIPAGALKTDQGQNTSQAQATLTVLDC